MNEANPEVLFRFKGIDGCSDSFRGDMVVGFTTDWPGKYPPPGFLSAVLVQVGEKITQVASTEPIADLEARYIAFTLRAWEIAEEKARRVEP